MSGDGKKHGFAHGCNTCHVSASTVGSWLIIDMDKGRKTSVFIELLMLPQRCRETVRHVFAFLFTVSQYRRNLAIIYRGIEWINRDMITVKIIVMGQRDITACYGTVT